MSLIKSEKISYSYPIVDEDFEEENEKAPQKAEKAISEVSLEIEQGQFVCILGRNGSGKSTFARHLNALIVPDEGTLWIDGMKTTNEGDIWNIRSTVGMVFQNPDNQIVATVVDEDVAFGPENIGMPSKEIVTKVGESLQMAGMESFAKSSPNKLSGGQKQRVAIAGILAMNPKCIVLDESTAMLDPRGRKEVMSKVLQLNKEHGITVVSITHYMDEALYADKIFVMAKGKVVMEGTPKEIFSRPEEINKLGLRLPQISHLAYELKKAGLDIPDGIIFEDELKEAILKLTCR